MSGLIRHPLLAHPVQVRRSRQARRITLRIDAPRRMATLVMPYRASQNTALAFLTDNLEWLRERMAALPETVPFAPGQSVPLLGEPHLLMPAPGARRGVWAEDGVIQVSGPVEFFARRTGDFLKAEAKKRILAKAMPMAEKIGRDFHGLRIGDPKSRWGSCNSKGKLAFSWRLVMAPEPVLDYVVAHEIAHLREMNHSPRFWEWVKALHEDCVTPRRWLKAHGTALYRYGNDTN